MKKKLVSIVLSIASVLACAVVPASADGGFKDVQGSPYETAINSLAEQEIVGGRGKGMYAPDEGLTRAEMVTIILRAYGSEEIEEDIEKFRDVPPTHWAYMFVETAYQMGIVNGVTETLFAPDTEVTYEQAVKMLMCAMKQETKSENAGGYPDGYIAVATELEVLNGVNGEKGETINRGAMAQLVYNCLNADTSSDYMIDWTGVGEQYNWIRDERMRCVYDGIGVLDEDDTGVLRRLENGGLNSCFLNLLHGEFDHKTYQGQVDMLDWAAARVNKYNLHTFIKINFGDNGYIGNTEMGKFHPGILLESYFDIPCPLSEKYWEKQMVERAKLIASYKEFAGIILDFEMYSGGKSQYTSKCMCNECWNKYITAKGYTGEWGAVDATERNDYLIKQNKLNEYNTWFEGEVTKIFANIREEIHTVNPNMIIGYFPAYEWIPGMTKGLGTKERPVLVASENEYWGSLADTKVRMQDIKANKDIHAIYCPGLYPGQGALDAATLETKIKQVAPTTAGYWMYSGHTLRVFEDNYAAVANANAQLDKELESGEYTQIPEYEIRSYKAKKIKGDTPTEEEWEAAPFTEPFQQYQKGAEGTVEVETTAKVLYSDDNFFVRMYAYDDMSTVTIGETQARDGNPWAGDCVEFFWKFDGTSDCAQLVSDLASSYWDAYSTGVGSKNTSVDFEGFTTETKLFDDRWEMTLTIPGTLDGVKKIKTGDVLRLEIGRYFPRANTNYCWAPTYGSYLGASSIWGIVELD